MLSQTARTTKPASQPTRPKTDRTHYILHLVLIVLGVALALTAFGLWLVPAGPGTPALSLAKLGISLFMLILGMCLLATARDMR